MISKFKEKTSGAINIAKEQYNKSFDFARIQNEKLKDKIDLKIQKKALLNLKAELALRQKSIEDYTDEELEILISNEKKKVIDSLKNKTLVAALAFLGLDFLI